MTDPPIIRLPDGTAPAVRAAYFLAWFDDAAAENWKHVVAMVEAEATGVEVFEILDAARAYYEVETAEKRADLAKWLAER